MIHAWQLFHWLGDAAHQVAREHEEDQLLRRTAPEEPADG
jgi:hypothetical protein